MDGAASMGRRARALALLAGTALCLATLAGVGGVAGAVTPGAEVIVHPGTTKPLASGGSRTPYGVVLPPGAACPGDTAHDGYLVYSYLVPGTASPTDVNFKRGIPNRWYGYIAAGSYFGAVNTAESTGQVVGLPYDFVWNSRIVFTADASDPGGFTWKVVDQGAVPSSQPVGLWIGVGLLVVAAGAAAYALSLRRRRSTGSTGGDGPPDGGSGPGADPSPAAGGGTETSEPTPVGAAER
jgi:hypothetical protein